MPAAWAGTASSTAGSRGSSSRATTIASARPVGRSAHLGVAGGDQRAPAGGSGRVDAQQSADGVGQLAHRARLGADRARHRALAPDHERHRPLAPVQVAVAADAAALAVVGHQDHGGVVELAALAEEGQEVAHVAVGLPPSAPGTRGCACRARGPAGRRPAAAAPAGRGPPPPRPCGPAAVSEWSIRAVGCTDVTDRTTSSPNGSSRCAMPTRRPALAGALQGVEHRLAAHPQPRREVGAHAVLGRRGAGEHGREADHRPRRVGGVHVQVLGALARQAVHRGRVGLPHALAVGAVDDDHVDAACTARCLTACGAVEAGRVGGQHVARRSGARPRSPARTQPPR